MKFGSLGTVIGHEVGHGYDPQGINYDDIGYYNPLEDEAAKNAFEKMKNCVVGQYNGYCPFNSTEYKHPCVDGKHTSGENMADVSGKYIIRS
jgi:putative endopeptidase